MLGPEPLPSYLLYGHSLNVQSTIAPIVFTLRSFPSCSVHDRSPYIYSTVFPFMFSRRWLPSYLLYGLSLHVQSTMTPLIFSLRSLSANLVQGHSAHVVPTLSIVMFSVWPLPLYYDRVNACPCAVKDHQVDPPPPKCISHIHASQVTSNEELTIATDGDSGSQPAKFSKFFPDRQTGTIVKVFVMTRQRPDLGVGRR